MNSIRSIKGMHDLLPDDSAPWLRLEQTAADLFARYGYRPIRVPILEQTELFERAIGTATDVVEKEMYSFEDLGGDMLSLRPEGTAGVVRAMLEHGQLYGQPQRLWYAGPMFRRERPQRGRLRQFHQIGAEVFGYAGPEIEAELIALTARLWQTLGLDGLVLEINSLGTTEERSAFRQALVDYLQDHFEDLDGHSQKRLETNPLRVLDSKSEQTRAVLENAPDLHDYLQDESSAHFEQLTKLLEQLGIEYRVNPRLVRGLDYYSHSVFEWITDELGAQGTVCAGGRYDDLVVIQGGKPWPGVGFAMGEERLVELLQAQGATDSVKLHAYLIMAGERARRHGLELAESLRSRHPHLRLEANVSGGSFKSQFKRADRSGAEFALVLGEDELDNDSVTVKPLRSRDEQQLMSRGELQRWLENLIRDKAH